MCVFSLISLYSQTPGSTLLPVFQKINEIEKISKLIDRRTSHIKEEKEKEKNQEEND